MMLVYSDEDNEPMRDDSILEYTGIINEKLFKETGECVVVKARDSEFEAIHGMKRRIRMIQLKVPEKCKDCKCCQMWWGGAMYYRCCSAPDPKNIGVDPESRPDWCIIVSTNEKLKEFKGNPTMETMAKMLAMSFGEIELEET